MKCDDISVEVILRLHEMKKLNYYIETEVKVNDIPFTGYFDIYGIFFDTHLTPKEDYSKPYSIYQIREYDNYQEHRANKRFDGIVSSVYLENCSCGYPGCINLYNGLRVYKNKKYFRYVAKKKDGYDKGILGSGKFNLTFSKEQIHQIRKNIIDVYLNNKDVLFENYEYEIDFLENYKKKMLK